MLGVALGRVVYLCRNPAGRQQETGCSCSAARMKCCGGGHRSLFGGWGAEEENGKLFKKYTCVENHRTVRLSYVGF